MAGPTKFIGSLSRYPARWGFSTAQSPFDDLTLHLEFLASPEFVIDLLWKKHGISKKDGAARAKVIRYHARLARLYIEQARASATEVSLLSCYYAVLNLLKIYIVVSSKHALLPRHRHHGARYNPSGPLSKSLLSEQISLQPRGALALFHEILSGKAVVSATRIKMRDVYSHIADVSLEWRMATGKECRLIAFQCDVDADGSSRRARYSITERHGRGENISRRQLPVFRDCKRMASDRSVYLARQSEANPLPVEELLRTPLDTRYIYYQNALFPTSTIASISDAPFPVIEELPIALSFFHLSNVVRYNPEFLAKLRDSKFWPVVASARTHCLYKFLLLFWSYMHQATVYTAQ